MILQILGHTLKNWLLIMDAYHAWMALPLKPSNVWGPSHLLPRYLEQELSRHVLRNIARFCLRAHSLRVETSCWQIHNRLCDKCDLHDVQDKEHVLFLMPLLRMCYLRRRFGEQFARCTGRTYIGDTGAFYFDNIGAKDVKLFLLKQTYKSFLFLSETMDIFCLAGSVHQAQQSTHLAEGLNPL